MESAMEKNIIRDNGGTRSGTDRRQTNSIYIKLNRRTGKDRRSGNDRREGAGHFITIERRDIYRKKDPYKI
jgi:hypothetical protein